MTYFNWREYMPAKMAHHSVHAGNGVSRLSPSELRCLLQSLQATLADIDLEYESDVNTVRDSSVDEWLKQMTIRKLQERHRERRMPCVAQLEHLQKRMHRWAV